VIAVSGFVVEFIRPAFVVVLSIQLTRCKY
jgi:hypothetical protein